MSVFKPPHRPEVLSHDTSVFLAGSIEMGVAQKWQDEIADLLIKEARYNIFNPRRDDWDSSWEQEISNEKFFEQVSWELDYLEKSDIIIFYFDPNTKSPITLMELGLSISIPAYKLVCCPKGFWRKGNVDVLCYRESIHQVETLEELKNTIPNLRYR